MPPIYSLSIAITIFMGILGGFILFGPDRSPGHTLRNEQIQLVSQFANSLAHDPATQKLVLVTSQHTSLRSPASSQANTQDAQDLNHTLQIPAVIDVEFVMNQGNAMIMRCEENRDPDCDSILREIAARDELSRYESENFLKAYLRRHHIPIQDRLVFYQNWRSKNQIPADDTDANELEAFLKIGGKRVFPIESDVQSEPPVHF